MLAADSTYLSTVKSPHRVKKTSLPALLVNIHTVLTETRIKHKKNTITAGVRTS